MYKTLKFPLLFLLIISAININAQSSVSNNRNPWIGYWKGNVAVGSMQIGLIFHVEESPTQTANSTTEINLKSTLDVPLQGLKDYAVDATIVTETGIEWQLGFGANFKGNRTPSNTLEGIWKQNGQQLPVIFTWSESLISQKPQTPKAPFSYEVKMVDFSHPSGKLKFSGTLTYPSSPRNKEEWSKDNLSAAASNSKIAMMPMIPSDNATTISSIAPFPIFPAAPALVKINIDTAGVHHQFPVVLLLSGSGPQDRDESIGDHKPFSVWADALTKSGFAVLRVDDRGTAKSVGDPNFLSTTTTESYVSDAIAAINHLGSLPMIDTSRVFVMGHSEGANVALKLAKVKHISGIISLAGATSSGIETSVYQNQQEWSNLGYSKEAQQELGNVHRKLIEIAINKGEQNSEILKEKPESIKTLQQEFATEFSKWIKSSSKQTQSAYKPWKNYNAKLAKVYGEKSTETFLAKNYIPLGVNPWMRYFLTYDPQPDFLALNQCDILMIQGGLDKQVNPIPSRKLATMMEENGVGVTYAEFSELNHLLQHAKTGTVREYFDLEETLAREAFISSSMWLLDRSRLR